MQGKDGIVAGSGFISFPKVRWLETEGVWDEPVVIRVAISEIINYGVWKLSRNQVGRTPFVITKVMVRPLNPEGLDPRELKTGTILASVDPREMDTILQPYMLTPTYRPL